MNVKMTEYQTLIGTDTQIAQNQFTASTSVTVIPESTSLMIRGAQLKFAYAGGATGAALNPPGTLYFFRSDPSVTAATANNGLTEAQVNAIVGQLDVADGDWVNLANNICELAHFGAMWVGTDSAYLGLPKYVTFYVAFLYTGATTINSAAGDEEALSVRFFYA